MNNENKRIFSPENLKRYAILSKKQFDEKARITRSDSVMYFYLSAIMVLFGAYISVVEENPILIDGLQIDGFNNFLMKIIYPSVSLEFGFALNIKAIEQVCKAAGLDVKSSEIEEYLKSLDVDLKKKKSEGGMRI